MNAISLQDFDPQTCVQKIYSSSVRRFNFGSGRGMLVDPADSADLVGQYHCLAKEKLNGAEFAELSQKMAQFRDKVKNFLSQQVVLVVLLRPYRRVIHQSHEDLTIGNYDWLWPCAGRDRHLEITDTEDTSVTSTVYGMNSPFHQYLERPLLVESMGKGEIYPLAKNENGEAISFVIYRGNAKIVFIPRTADSADRSRLVAILQDIFDPECWPPVKSNISIEPIWLREYNLPEIELLEKTLAEKEEKIVNLEEECDSIHRYLLQIKLLQKNLLSGNARKMSRSLSTIFTQWGNESTLCGDYLRLKQGEKEGVLLSFCCDGEAKKWPGKKLARMAATQKSILVVNAYRNTDPQKKDLILYSQGLVDFCLEHDIALVSCRDIFQAYSMGREDFLKKIWTSKGIVSFSPEK